MGDVRLGTVYMCKSKLPGQPPGLPSLTGQGRRCEARSQTMQRVSKSAYCARGTTLPPPLARRKQRHTSAASGGDSDHRFPTASPVPGPRHGVPRCLYPRYVTTRITSTSQKQVCVAAPESRRRHKEEKGFRPCCSTILYCVRITCTDDIVCVIDANRITDIFHASKPRSPHVQDMHCITRPVNNRNNARPSSSS